VRSTVYSVGSAILAQRGDVAALAALPILGVSPTVSVAGATREKNFNGGCR
jgi:hypothetical protein